MTHTPVALPGPRRVPVFLPETLPEVDPELLPDRGGSGDSGGCTKRSSSKAAVADPEAMPILKPVTMAAGTVMTSSGTATCGPA